MVSDSDYGKLKMLIQSQEFDEAQTLLSRIKKAENSWKMDARFLFLAARLFSLQDESLEAEKVWDMLSMLTAEEFSVIHEEAALDRAWMYLREKRFIKAGALANRFLELYQPVVNSDCLAAVKTIKGITLYRRHCYRDAVKLFQEANELWNGCAEANKIWREASDSCWLKAVKKYRGRQAADAVRLVINTHDYSKSSLLSRLGKMICV